MANNQIKNSKANKKSEEKIMTQEINAATIAKEPNKKNANYFERKIVFSNFRNLGIGEKTELILNKSNSNSVGELIIIIGANNSGKTGILNGVEALHKGIDETLDLPDFVFEDTDTYVRLKLVSGKSEWAYEVRPNGIVNVYGDDNDANAEKFVLSKELSDFLSDVGYYVQRDKIIALKSLTRSEYSDIMSEINYYCSYRDDADDDEEREKLRNEIENYMQFIEGKKPVEALKKEVNEKVLKQSGINFVPTIVWYKEEEFKQKDLRASVKKLNESNFFCKMLGMLGIRIDDIQNIHKKYEENGKPFLTKYQKLLNEKLRGFTDKFNKMYAFDGNNYKFIFSFEADKFHFEIFYEDDTPLDLDKQSTGFKWFFNFFLNVLNNGNLHNGDIVLMDEPATHLHAHAIAELREFVKAYAKESGITFIMTTNLPFLIDIDYLDEIRIVKRWGKREDNK